MTAGQSSMKWMTRGAPVVSITPVVSLIQFSDASWV